MQQNQQQIETGTETGGSHTNFENIVNHTTTNDDDQRDSLTPQSNQEKEDGYS